MLLQWGADNDKIISRIKNTKGFLKIILKTYNDGFFLERWIKHHANIVGLENLIIADNMSTDADVLDVYKKYEKKLCVFGFSGHHNHIHNRELFKYFYDAIQLSCNYVLFIDTDEFLVFFEKFRWTANKKIQSNLRYFLKNGSHQFIITVALHNLSCSDEHFFIDIPDGIKWGKTLFSHKIIENCTAMHNIQIPQHFFEKELPISMNLFLLHLDKFSTEQRIKVNKNKLIKRGLCSDCDDVDSILKKDWSKCKDPTAIRFINEMEECMKNKSTKKTYREIPEGCLRLLPNGAIEFAGDAERSAFEEFINEPEKNIRLSLNIVSEDQLSILIQATRCRDINDFSMAEDIFRQGMKKYPNQLDHYGHPVFQKELMRMFLNQKRWDEAVALIPMSEDIIEYWHEILFARTYSAVNDEINAKLWWTRVIESEPNNQEAKDYFLKCDKEINNSAQIAQEISALPHMEKEGIDLLEEHLKKTKIFLEYGSGGSTVFAAKLGVKTIYSVDSDNNFLDAVHNKIALLYPSVEVKTHFVNIGKTKDWGHPVNKEHADHWPNYCVAPWQEIIKSNNYPDLILIDGRFRVACFLACLILAKHRTIILFDDYTNRSEYHIVEKYLRPNKTSGRMAKFIVNKNFSVSEILLDLMLYATNPA